MSYGIEMKVGNKWLPVRPPTSPPYEFKSKAEAETMARVLFPDLKREGEDAVVRVSPKKEEA